MEVNRKKKRILKLILAIIVCIVILIIILIVANVKENTIEDVLIYDTTEREEINYPYMGYKFFQYYTGTMSSDDMARSMSDVAESVLPNYYNKLKGASESEIKEFYDENTEEILEKLGISDVENFVEIINYISDLNSETLVYESYRIDTDNYSKDSKYSYCYLYITYENEEEIVFKVAVNNKAKSANPDLIYTIVK